MHIYTIFMPMSEQQQHVDDYNDGQLKHIQHFQLYIYTRTSAHLTDTSENCNGTILH